MTQCEMPHKQYGSRSCLRSIFLTGPIWSRRCSTDDERGLQFRSIQLKYQKKEPRGYVTFYGFACFMYAAGLFPPLNYYRTILPYIGTMLGCVLYNRSCRRAFPIKSASFEYLS